MRIFLFIFLSILLSSCAMGKLDPIEEQKRQAEFVERCRELKKDIAKLKGKPVQRGAAVDYFESECILRNEEDFNHGSVKF